MAPELAVYLNGNMPARGLSPDFLSREGFRIAVQWSLRQYAGEDVGSQNTAHLLDQDNLQLAAGEGGFFGYLYEYIYPRCFGQPKIDKTGAEVRS